MPWLEGESGTWDGGRVFVEHDGSKTFHIRKSVGGVRHEFSTRCSKLGPAMKAYEMKARTHRKAVIKHLYTFCREKGLISRDEDPTFDLALPQAGSGISKKERAVTREEFERTLAKVAGDQYRDLLALQAGTGMHVMEAQRLAQGQGLVGPDFVAIQHKRGTLHRQAVEPDVAAAARRAQERGSFSVSRYSKAVRKAANAAGVREWAPGSMRHSVTTWLLDEGATLDQVSTWLGHARAPPFDSTLETITRNRGETIAASAIA